MAHRTNALRRLSIRLVVMCVVIASVIVGGVWWAMATVNNSQLASRYQTLMALNRLGGTQAPNFTLTDQNGNQVSLSSFRGQNVVLSFIDPKCTDICPIVSQEFIRADKTLGDTSKSTVFLGVNVNQYHESTADVLAFSRSEGLQKLPNWHFLTGSTAALKHVW
ncbi:MAG: redoxin domain-containing protein [Alicyclobacillus sp.]|nr:redoxin domain-containing protein [Alicyclobacillus sp.]